MRLSVGKTDKTDEKPVGLISWRWLDLVGRLGEERRQPGKLQEGVARFPAFQNRVFVTLVPEGVPSRLGVRVLQLKWRSSAWRGRRAKGDVLFLRRTA